MFLRRSPQPGHPRLSERIRRAEGHLAGPRNEELERLEAIYREGGLVALGKHYFCCKGDKSHPAETWKAMMNKLEIADPQEKQLREIEMALQREGFAMHLGALVSERRARGGLLVCFVLCQAIL